MSTPSVSVPPPLPAGTYARALKAVLPARAFQPVPHRLLWLIPHLLVAVGGIGLVATRAWPWPALLALSLAIGQAFACMGFLGHEILHGSVVRSPWLRQLLGQLCLWPFWVGPRLWRRWHNVEHHGHTQRHGEDPDAAHTLEDFHARPALRALYRLAPGLRAVLMAASLSVWFSVHSVQVLRRFLPTFPPRERRTVLLQFALPLASWLALLPALGVRGWWWAYGLPLLVANLTVMSYIVTNHLLNPLTGVNDPLANSLSVRVPRWVDVLHLNFSHHVEHHVFPGMSPRYAPLVRRWCRRLWPDRYHELPHGRALWLFLWTPRVYGQPTQLVDPVRRLAYPVIGHGLESGPLRPAPLDGGPVPARLQWPGLDGGGPSRR